MFAAIRSSIGFVLLVAATAIAASPKEKPTRPERPSQPRENARFDFVQPHIVLQNAEAIGVSSDTLQEIKTILRRLEKDSTALRSKAKNARRQLTELFDDAVIDEAKSVEAFETMLAAERADKTLQLRTLIQLRNRLTLEQRQIAKQLQAAKSLSSRQSLGKINSPYPSENLPVIRIAEPPRRIAMKMQSIRQAQRQMQRDGGDTAQVRRLLRQASPLMKRGKEADAEQLLDEAIELLDENAKQPTGAP
jgi:Spy/CpxP family protein refolding chaperone